MVEQIRQLLGDALWDRAAARSEELNQSEILTAIRERTISRDQYIGFISGMYPAVVGFNRALIRSLSKVDNVRDAWLVKILAEQLKEEQIHNDMWRAKLDIFGVDHMAIWMHLRDYVNLVGKDYLDAATNGVIEALIEDPENFCPGCFKACKLPEPSYALFHHMYSIADSPLTSFWAHFASQSVMEATIYAIVSESIYPGVVGNPELDHGARTTVWWKEHARQGGSDDRPGTEEKHLRIARSQLNRQQDIPDSFESLLKTANQTLLLFSAAIRCHGPSKAVAWNLDEFMKAQHR